MEPQRHGADARRPVGLVLLLATALMVNYIDRGTISTAAPLIEHEFALSASEMGWVLAAFFWAYAPMQPVSGWFADRLGPARVLAAGFTLWSVATATTSVAWGLGALVALRLLMGIGESAFYPSALSLLSRNVVPQQRGFATATMQFGAVIGPFIGTYLGGQLMLHYGWRPMFAVMGFASLAWLVFWRRWRRRQTATGRDDAASATVTQTSTSAQPGTAADLPYGLILRQRALWGGMLGTFCGNYAFYFVFTWLPLYLTNERGLSLETMTWAASLFYVFDGASVLLVGWALDAWVRRGASFNRAYKTALGLSSAGVGLCLIASTQASHLTVAIGILWLTGIMDGFNSPSNPSVTQTFAGPRATGRWMGIQNAVGNVAGMTAPVVTGYLVQQTGHYTSALLVAGCVALGGLLAWLVVVPEVRPIDWDAELARHLRLRDAALRT
jgi:MFS family permease